MDYYFQPEIITGSNFLNEEESRHCVKVLRHAPGDEITIADGQGGVYQAEIVEANPNQCEFRILSERSFPRRTNSVTIIIAPTKSHDRLEWFVEKATEIGVDAIQLIKCNNSERSRVRMDRLRKKAIEALKQSKNPYLPEILDIAAVQEVVSSTTAQNRFIAHVDEANPHRLQSSITESGESVILIGPEGDFAASEVAMALENGFKKVSLGKNTLRTETAGIIACQILCSSNQ